MRDEEMDMIRGNEGMEENGKTQVLGAKRRESIDKVLEEVEVLTTHTSLTNSQRANPHFSEGVPKPTHN